LKLAPDDTPLGEVYQFHVTSDRHNDEEMRSELGAIFPSLRDPGETQALIYHPKLKKVIGIDALGVAPTGATADFFHSKGYRYPPEYGPLAAVTPGTPGGLMTMLVLRPEGARRSRALAIWPDTMPAGEFRRLRVLLRHGDPGSART
jgi:hypothetical protein